MKDRPKNPHPFDMSTYLHGQTFEIGGKEGENEIISRPATDQRKKTSHRLDWSFLRRASKKMKRS